ncbi:glycerophosphodiester phosphodiesterase [Tepidiforma sp.]|uniref:glycerophosphodiester phosphodiesterase n=1 Tax=Tepidiforma sp. TaxID=2682230 RepID=UPI002ADD6C46|nr:glycerophosphodiester phosphodiesterase [Tepidiforma sp.]
MPAAPPLDGLSAERRPFLIAHGAGNSPALARAAIAERPDAIEVDLWLHRGRFEARHERRIRFFPFLVETWYIKRPHSPHFGLQELLDLTAGSGTALLLDLKNGGREAARALHRILEYRAESPPILASSQSWQLLRALRELQPGLPLLYSIDVRAKLDLFLAVADRDPHPAGISCRHTLLDEPTIRALRARGIAVIAWTVDDLDRASDLAAWGVDGITTHRVAELRAALHPVP